MKTFEDVYNEIKSNVTVTKSGKPKKTFSRSDFDKMLKAMLNDTDYKAVYCSTKNGEMVKNEVEVVKMFRASLKRLLTASGVDAQEAENMAATYQFTNVDGWYELFSEIIYQYMSAGKKFDFPTRETFKGSLTIKDVEKSIGTYRSIKKPGDKSPAKEFKIETKSHQILEKKSKAPDWLKKKFK